MSILNNLNLSSFSVRDLLCTVLTEDLAERVLAEFSSLTDVSRASYEEFTEVGFEESEIQRIRTVLELSARYWSQIPNVGKVTTPSEWYRLLEPLMQNKEQEMVRVVLLDKDCNVLSTPIITVGTLSSSLVHPREMFKQAIRDNAASIIMAHQHPSGDPTPSRDDFSATVRIVKAGTLLDVKVLDHMILGSPGRYFSFREQGQL
jgi:DNA repair protein RadC